MLPNGKVLVEGNSGWFYEFDGTNFTRTLSSFGGSLMVLPTGEVLIDGSQVYTPTGNGLQIWAPIVTIAPSTVQRGQTYHIYGRQFNGLSQAASFGDEFETATNYPLVRIKNNATGHIFYAKTHNHSQMGVRNAQYSLLHECRRAGGNGNRGEHVVCRYQWDRLQSDQHYGELGHGASKC